MKLWSGGQITACAATFDGTKLRGFADDYEVFLICGVDLPMQDRFTSTAISVSAPYHIEPRDILIAMPVGEGMQEVIDAERDSAKAKYPNRSDLSINFRLWYEIVVLPRGFGGAQIRNLSDVERLQGRLFPGEGRGSTISTPIL